jgi:hypothetical protein
VLKTKSTPSAVKPAPDMGATICHPNDRYSATILACYGHAGASHGDRAGWPLSLDVSKDEDDRELRKFTLRADGTYREAGRPSPSLRIGEREDHLNPSG